MSHLEGTLFLSSSSSIRFLSREFFSKSKRIGDDPGPYVPGKLDKFTSLDINDWLDNSSSVKI